MELLLDTHTLIWFFNGDENLSKKALQLIVDSNNEKFVSKASLWEIAIKINLNKLYFDGNTSGVAELIERNGFQILDMSIKHLIAYESLEIIHRDPFDRILVSQAIVNNMLIITKDDNIKKYNIKTKW
jgi:PIN domain nuclease of toxin-antitoxin system